jgi:DNA-binding GntR family transcriptional regulator
MLNFKALREQVYEYLRGEIHAGRIVTNSTLDLNAISETLGVSKTPLRDALFKLEAEGFVTILPRRGVIVNGLTLEEVKNFYQIIGALEGDVLKEVFDKLDAVRIESMRQITANMREVLGKDDFDTYYEMNIRFHDVFLELTSNGILRPLIMPMKQRLYDFQRHPYVKDWEFRNCDEHDQMVDAIRQRNVKGAVQLLRDVHWSFQVQKDYIKKYYNFILQEASNGHV